MLIGNQIQLRLIKETDLAALYEKWHDAEARGSYYPLAVVPEPTFYQAFARDGFWSADSKRILITDLKDHMLGILHAAKASHYSDSIELSYFLFDTKKRNKGYVTEAVTLFIDYFFKNTSVNRIQICAPVNHLASSRVAEKAGFTREGIARGSLFLNGEYVDMAVYSLLRREWKVKN